MKELPFERLDVYQVALKFAAEAHRLCAELGPGFGHIASQLRRSSCSVVTNTAEAATEFSPAEESRIFRIALRSGGESLALIALLVELGSVPATRVAELRQLGVRSIAMLMRLAQPIGRRGKGWASRQRTTENENENESENVR
jgi:four helix bundle protein